ncbi:putative L-carnitine dehydratase [Umbelopsis sp. AD052]|nr:putative L-carnitine dehydratase [Umbelopsis sp. AD052]
MVYSVPEASFQVLVDGILNNPKTKVPEDVKALASNVRFKGTDSPSIPINWRLAESISALKAYEGLSVAALISQKYKTEAPVVTIDTDHAQLSIMSPMVVTYQRTTADKEPVSLFHPDFRTISAQHFKDMDKYHSIDYPWNSLATNIYKTKDERYYHIHGSMNSSFTKAALGIPQRPPKDPISFEETLPLYEQAVAKHNADALDTMMNDEHKQAGTICYTVDEFKATDHYKANAHVELFETHRVEDGTPASWWKLADQGSLERPLAGLKVLDVTRVIAAPAVTRSLAEYGASVMRITSPNLPDMSSLHPDLSWGKWQCELDFHNENDRQKLLELLEEADVVVEGYRPYHLEKYGLGKDNLLALAQRRGRGIIYVRENCYGWQGPWHERIGWQQISDAVCGVSRSFADALGAKGEAITPVFPNSDFCTGTAGAIAVIQALTDQAKNGGSHVVDLALNYYSMWLVNQVGTYDDEQWKKVWESNGKPSLRHYDNMQRLLPQYIGLLRKHSPHLFQPAFFNTEKLLDDITQITVVAPTIVFSGPTRPGYHIKTRGNGTDAPFWPNNLATQVVSERSQ